MTATLARGKYVVASRSEADELLVIEDGAIAYEADRILAVGPYEELLASYRPDAILGSTNDVVMPGLVNAHHHVGLTPFQLGVPDLPLELWVVARLGCPPVDPYLDALVSAFEMIESGVTAVHHLQGRIPRPVGEWREYIDQSIRAYRDVGMRVTYSVSLRDQGRIVYGDDAAFLSTLPADLAGPARDMIRMQDVSAESQLEHFFAELFDAYGRNQGDGVRIQLAPANLHWCSDRALSLVAEYARSNSAGIHMHLLETPYQKAYARSRGQGLTAVEYLQRLDLLGPRLTLGHGVWMTESDLDLVAGADVGVCHNPSSNLRLRSGVAPVNELLARGVPVALGLDEAGINDDRDMLQEMRVALNVHRVPGHGGLVPSPRDAFHMATKAGARTTAFGAEIGALRAGAYADFSLVDWGRVEGAYLAPGADVVDSLVHRATPAAVKAVVIGGSEVLRDGQFVQVDKPAALAELRRRMAGVDPEALARSRAWAQGMLAHVRAFYDGWLDDDRGDPFYRVNARR